MKRGELIQNAVIESMAAEGKCVARINNLVVFVTGAVPGDVADLEITKVKTQYLEAKAIHIHSFSNTRNEPFCNHFGTCGGCVWQHLDYQVQLQYKQQQVADALQHIGGLTLPTIQTIIPSQKTQLYRNRLDFTFTANRWLTKAEMQSGKSFGDPGLGFHIPKMFDKVFDVEKCYLQNEPSNAIRIYLKKYAIENNISFYDLRKQTGYLRTVTIRTSTEDETMVILQVAENKPEILHPLLDSIYSSFEIHSLNYVINSKRNDTFFDLPIHTYKGNAWITESMPSPEGDKKIYFRVGPKSFYQTNSQQAYELYKVAYAMADLNGDDLVYDLYTGTGTIANFVASKARKVVGLEYVASAIEDAKENSKLNGITNTDFFAGDIKDLLDEKFINKHGRPVVVITDPPRAGMHEDVCKMLLQASPNRIVYVSCNPATQARDLKILSEKYQVSAIQPVDMFPHTMHVENVVRLDLKL